MRVNRGNTGDLTELATQIKLGLLGGKNPETLQFFAKRTTAGSEKAHGIRHSSENTTRYTPVGRCRSDGWEVQSCPSQSRVMLRGSLVYALRNA